MRLTEKSQVTIPKRVRQVLGIGPGSEVDFQVDETGVRLVKAADREGETRGERIVRLLREAGRGARRNGLSADEILDMTRGPFNDLDPG